MPTKIMAITNASFQLSSTTWPNAEVGDVNKTIDNLKKFFAGGGKDPVLLIAPKELERNAEIHSALAAAPNYSLLFFHKPEDVSLMSAKLGFLHSADRTSGVKAYLEKGTTIYNETFFNANQVGEKIDSCFRFARSKLSSSGAVRAWGAIQAAAFVGIQTLPDQGEKGTGEKVDVQVGADSNVLAVTVRFDCSKEALQSLQSNPILTGPCGAADLFELRYVAEGSKAEAVCLFYLSNAPAAPIRIQTVEATAPLENSNNSSGYDYQTFGSLRGVGVEEKRVVKGGFKKKFSQQVAEVKPNAPAEAPAPAAEVKAEAPAPQKVVVSGSSSMGSKEAPKVVAATPTPTAPQGKSEALLQSKIESLEADLKQREELILKLNKQIEENVDPMKRGVITNIKDSHMKGFQDNIARLEKELAEAQAREKELMTVVDKAIQMKDDAVKKLKVAEAKLGQSQGGNNSRVVMLEKQLEEQKRQNKELSKKISQLMEQAKAA